jgi:molecular chaperone DnaJ
MFKKINRAYEVLSDQDKRQVYDQQGPEALERYERYA